MRNEMTQSPLVSIVMPAYNCSEYISITLESIISQTYVNWEVIIVDDCSTDNTIEIITAYMNRDNRIKYHKLKENSGAAVARNLAVTKANGVYIAFIDSDDVWFKEKLSKQISFMEENNYHFTCTSYNKIDRYGNELNKIVKARIKSNYNDILKKSPGNSTVIYNSGKLGKFIIPDIRKRNDYVMWLQVIKKGKILYGINETLSSHRVREGSISHNKNGLLKYHWIVYQDIEKLNLFKSIYLIFYWIFATILRNIRSKSDSK